VSFLTFFSSLFFTQNSQTSSQQNSHIKKGTQDYCQNTGISSIYGSKIDFALHPVEKQQLYKQSVRRTVDGGRRVSDNQPSSRESCALGVSLHATL